LGALMPTFDTPQPITARLNLGFIAAEVRVHVDDRATTTVEVRPADRENNADVRIADQTRIEYADSALVIQAPRFGTLFGRTGSIDVTLELPSGSSLHGKTGMGEVRCEGRLGDCHVSTGYGDIWLDQADAVHLRSGSGDIHADRVNGTADISAGDGAVSIRHIDGRGTLKNSNGSSWIGEAAGEVALQAANGAIVVDRAHADVTAKTANGDIRIGEVQRGAVTLETAAGSIDVGVRAGTAAWLDVHTRFGRVRNELAATTSPDDTDETVEVRARTAIGDILIRRSPDGGTT
jgi:DUF4097 and DUF4098 domain-containing protein YvlB